MDILNIFLNSLKNFYTDTRGYLDKNFLDNFGIGSEDLLMLVVLTFVIVFVINRSKKYLIAKLERKAEKTLTLFDDKLVQKIKEIGIWFYLIITVFFLSNIFSIDGTAAKIIDTLTIITIFAKASGLIELIASILLSRSGKRKGEVDPTIKNIFVTVAKSAIWIIAFLLVLSALDYDISNLATGLGVTGIVLGFALQNVLSDIFSSISIYIDQPFKVGDMIEVGADSGTILKIGLKSTRIKTLRGEELTISNKELTETRIHNYHRLERRRDLFSIGVVYETKSETIEKIPNIVKNIIEDVEDVEFSRCHFSEFGDFSLNFEIAYFVNSNDYVVYMNKKQEINLAIMKEFEKQEIEFAFPSQTVYLAK